MKTLSLFLSIFILNFTAMSQQSVHDFTINTIDGEKLDLSSLKGKKLLIVNTASECGFTPQYKELEKLYNTHANNLVVIGVPCNQFGKQEPGNNDEIEEFCKVNYGVSFLITEKIDVKGKEQHPLYNWLTSRELNNKKRNDKIEPSRFLKDLNFVKVNKVPNLIG